MIRATTLPQVRGHMVAGLRADADHARALDPATHPQATQVARLWDAEARGLKDGALWWVSRDMTTLAADTALCGLDIPDWDFHGDLRTGLALFDGGLPLTLPHTDEVVDAISWARFPEIPQHKLMGDLRISGWTKKTNRSGGRAGLEKIIMPDANSPGSPPAVAVPVGTVWMSPEIALWRILVATMLLAHEPKVAGTRPANLATDGHPQETRDRPMPDVTVIDLRTVRDWKVGPDVGAPAAGREYTHRWIVRGHSKTYWVGKGRERSEKRWIAPYVAGPEGAPLVPKEQVWVWRR